MAGLTPEVLRKLFTQEAEVRLSRLSELLLDLEHNPGNEPLIRSIFRELHTLKGSSAVVGLNEVSDIAHGLEELVDDLRRGRRTVTPEVIDTLLRGADRLGITIGVRHQAIPGGSVQSVEAPATTPALTEAARTGKADDTGAVAVMTAASVRADTLATSSRPMAAESAAIMVPVERLEELTRLVGETASAHLRVGRMLKDRLGVDPATYSEFNELSRLLNTLQDRAVRTQMVPMSTVTGQLQRVVRDLARAQGKDVAWDARGIDTELDRGVLAQLVDCLVHLVRNAVDHGVEASMERTAAGKPPQASLRLHAMQLGSEVIIAVTDDGRGIDAAAVAAQAARLGIDTGTLSRSELLELAFTPGLSTASFVTDVSGRGVGLDVVRSNVDAVHGRVEIRSEAGVGTEFRIVVPITVAVLRCLLVEAGGQTFALPFHRVLLTRAMHADDLGSAEGRTVTWLHDQPVPVHDLVVVLGLPTGSTTGPLVVLTDTARTHAFAVDRLLGQRDVVIKALNPIIPPLAAVAGASVEPDGSVLLVLDPPGLIQRARRISRAAASAPPPVQLVTGPRRSVLVVDDALTIRELQRNILERAGFSVRVATDGRQALSALTEEGSDLVLTDVEMPNMDGFALTEAIRAHPTLAGTPVLMLTSRASETDRQHGFDVGANGYITKSGFDEAALLTAVNRLIGVTP